MTDEFSLARAQGSIRSFLGSAHLADLHRPNPFLDFGTILALPLLAIVIIAGCFLLNSLALLCGLALAQGIVLQLFGLLNHEFFVHRKVGGQFSYWLSVAFTLPIQLSSTRYADAHWAHHEFVGSADDAESYKLDLDSRFKKLLFMTVVGTKWAASGKMGGGRAPYFELRKPTSRAVRRARVEKIFLLLFLGGAGVVTVLYPIPMLFGYFLPLLVILPLLNSLRILLEHAEMQTENVYSIASRFQCGIVEDLVFLYDSGEYHLIHHFLPNVPYYRMRRARSLLDPFFDVHQVEHSRGWLHLLSNWFWRNKPHGGWWVQDEITPSNSRAGKG
jgi:fatty acid desaturase